MSLGTIVLRGATGKSHVFTVYPLGTTFGVVGAVYFITKRIVTNGASDHQGIYLGMTEDLSTNLEGHNKADCFSEHGANCIAIYTCNSNEERQEIKKDILAKQTFFCS